MGLVELVILAVGLSMDAFAISICKGLSLGRTTAKHMCLAGVWFGGAQAVMPVIGYFLGSLFAGFIENWAHWVAFILLAVIGVNMILEAFKPEENVDPSMSVKSMFVLSIADSIDALAVGVTFASMQVNIALAAVLIGVVTFGFSAAGIKIGSVFGCKYRAKAVVAGGVILILIGTKALLEGLGIIA